jgi:hypothetical protein
MYVKADELETPESRKALCERMQADVRAGKKHFKKDFDRMIEDMDIAMTGKVKKWCETKYTVNITQRFIRQKVAALYAKNPQAVAKRNTARLEYRLWDGDSASLQAAQEQIMMAAENGMPPPQEAIALLQDVSEGSQRSTMIGRVGKTMECLYAYYLNEQQPGFKSQMKGCVRATVQCGIGYMKMGFQREMDLAPENKAKLADFAQRIAHLEMLENKNQDPEAMLDDTSAEAEELRLAQKSLQEEKQVITREGMVFDFPACTSIIPDPRCTSVNGWIGADWLAEELFMTSDEIKEFFNIDLGQKGMKYNHYSTQGAVYKRNPRNDLSGKNEDLALVWIYWHKPTGLKYTLADGHSDFLEEPTHPDVTLERFFPVYALCYNEILHATRIFPPSDVRLMKDQQMELNRTREAMREHRMANRPGYAVPRGSLTEHDKETLGEHPPNALVEMDGLIPGQKIADIMQALPKIGVDPNLYDTGPVMNDVFLAVGANESTFGTTSGATATESSIAESNRSSAIEAEIDELNDFLTLMARDAGQVMLAELDIETVKEIVGPGAIWPEMSQEDIQKEVYLSVVAGSNGRPNRAAKQQALQMVGPFLLQIPGISPEWLAKMMIETIDDSIDLSEAIAKNMPSVMMMNNQTQATGAEDDPNAQGGAGGNNAAQPAQPSQGAGAQGDRPTTAQA